MTGSNGTAFIPFFIAGVGMIVYAQWWYAGVAMLLVAIFLTWSKRVHGWANLYIQGETIAFYDDMLKQWDVSVSCHNLKPPSPAGRWQLRRNVRLARNDTLLCQAYLLQFRATLREDYADFHDLPREHWVRLNAKTEELFQRAQELPRFSPWDFVNSSIETPGLKLLQTKLG